MTTPAHWMAICLICVPTLLIGQTTDQRFAAHGLALPATFSGTLPCADCEGIVHHLDLWADGQGYALRRVYLGRDETLDELGRWHVDPSRNALILEGTGNASSEWQITANQQVRLLDQEGLPIESDLPYTLEPGPFAPTDLELPVTGLMTYFADAALFTECFTGQRFPIAMEADYLPLERAYLAAELAPNAPLLAHIDAQISLRPQMEGPDRRTVTIKRFHHVTPDAGCPDNLGAAALSNTYWGLTLLNGMEPEHKNARQEPYLLMFEEEMHFSGTIGCNQVIGSLDLGEDGLRFGPVGSTMMACPPETAGLEADFIQALEATRASDLDDQTLRLLDEDGVELARFRALYTRR